MNISAQTKHAKTTDLLELSFWSSLSVLWLAFMTGVGEQLWMWAVYAAQEANFICSLCNSLDSRRLTSTQKPGSNPHISSVALVEKKRAGCTERALKLHFVPLCIITITRDPWCIAVSCWDGGQNDSATRKNSICPLGQTLKMLHDHP